MNRSAGSLEIADLVARAERVKRNREIVLRTFKTPAGIRPPRRSTSFSPALRLKVVQRAALAVPPLGDAGRFAS
jgi:hypothetical protein